MFELQEVRIAETRIIGFLLRDFQGIRKFCSNYLKKFKIHEFELDRVDCSFLQPILHLFFFR